MIHGQYNQRVDIEARQSGRDAFGQPVDGWQSIAKVWANVRYQTGMSAIKSDADVSEVRASVRIRYREGVNAGHRVVVNGRIYEIEAVQPDLIAREHLDLTCKVMS